MKNRDFNLFIQLFASPDTGNGTRGGETKTFTQEEVDKMIADRIAREKRKSDAEKKELERKHNESIEEYEDRIRTANMTADEKYKHELKKRDDLLAERDGELNKIKTDSLKKSTLAKYKLPDTFLGRISGITEEEIEASVKEFQEGVSEYLKSQGGGTPSNLSGGSEQKEKDEVLESFDKEFI